MPTRVQRKSMAAAARTMATTASSVLALGLLVTLMMLASSSAPFVHANSAPRVGRDGFAAYFDHRRSDIISFKYVGVTASNAITMEAWYKNVDPFMGYHSLTSYGAYSFATNPPTAQGDGLTTFVAPYFTALAREYYGRTCLGVAGCQSAWSGGWTHVAMTWRLSDQQTIFYINGTAVYNVSGAIGGAYAEAVLPNGCFVIGQQARTVCGSMNEAQALDGFIDEMRVWTSERTQAQIQAGMFASIPPENIPSDLSFYFKFDGPAAGGDNPNRISQEPDMAGHANHGLIGQVADYQGIMTWNSARLPGLPTRPLYVASGRQTDDSRNVIVYCSPGVQITITLDSYDPDAGDTLTYTLVVGLGPSYGTLVNFDGSTITGPLTDTARPPRVKYTASSSTFTQTQDGDIFMFIVDDSTVQTYGTVHILYDALPVTPNVTQSLPADVMSYMILGGVAHGGMILNTKILSLPAHGKLYLAQFTDLPSGFASLPPIEQYTAMTTDPTLLTPITTVPTTLTNVRGVVMYQPGLYEYGSPYARFLYTWTDGVRDSVPGWVNINVLYSNHPPVPISQNVTSVVGATSNNPASNSTVGATIITLNGTVIDPTFNPNLEFIVSRKPARGSLRQYANGALGADITVTSAASVFSYVKNVVGISSEYSLCAECYYNMSCAGGCASSGTSWMAQNVIGAPDVYPAYGLANGAWLPYAFSNPLEFLELEFPFAMHVSAIQIYETYHPGCTVAVKVADEYAGASTAWRTVWQGPTTSATLPPETSRIFAPPLCMSATLARFVRLEFDLSAVSWSGVDAVQLIGTLDPPSGFVFNTAGKLAYIPANSGAYGVDAYTPFDSFDVKVSNCLTTSPTAATITILRPPPSMAALQAQVMANTLTPWATVSVQMRMVTDATSTELVTIDLRAIRADAGVSATSTVYIAYQAQYAAAAAADIGALTFLQASNTSDGTAVAGAPFTLPTTLASTTASASFFVTAQPSLAVEQPAVTVLALVTAGRAQYLVAVNVNPSCPPSQWARSSDNACVPCSQITDTQKQSMNPSDLLLLDQSCFTQFSFSSTTRSVLIAIVAVCMAVTVLIGGFILKYQESAVIKKSSVLFLMIALAGALMLFVACILIVQPVTDGLCLARGWIGHTGFALFFGALFIKTHRLARIFTNPKLRVIRIPNSELLRGLGLLLCAMWIFLAVWSGVDPPSVSTVTRQSALQTYVTCQSDSSAFTAVILSAEGLLLLWGVYLCVQVRSIPGEYNESRHISMALYAIFFSCVIVVPLLYALLDDPNANIIVMVVAIALETMVSVGLVFGPKLLVLASNAVYRTSGADNVHAGTRLDAGDANANGTSHQNGTGEGGAEATGKTHSTGHNTPGGAGTPGGTVVVHPKHKAAVAAGTGSNGSPALGGRTQSLGGGAGGMPLMSRVSTAGGASPPAAGGAAAAGGGGNNVMVTVTGPTPTLGGAGGGGAPGLAPVQEGGGGTATTGVATPASSFHVTPASNAVPAPVQAFSLQSP